MAELYIRHFPEAAGHMPIPPVAEHMETFKAGAVTIGVEYRILTNELIATMGMKASSDLGQLDDTGVSLHVYAKGADGDLERLRFDCFKDDPHYHYISWAKKTNEHVFIDPHVHGDILAWALETIRARLPEMLERAGIENAEQVVDRKRLEQILPLVTESAYRSRLNVDKDRITRGAMADGARRRA
jgi:hypothetical protein